MRELKRPKIFGDRLMVMLAKVDKEIQVMDDFIIERDDIFFNDDDAANVARMQMDLQKVYNDLANDEIRGEPAVTRLKEEFLETEPYRDLIYRMTDSDEFPELKYFAGFCEENG